MLLRNTSAGRIVSLACSPIGSSNMIALLVTAAVALPAAALAEFIADSFNDMNQ